MKLMKIRERRVEREKKNDSAIGNAASSLLHILVI